MDKTLVKIKWMFEIFEKKKKKKKVESRKMGIFIY